MRHRAPLVALVCLAACAGQRPRVPVIVTLASESEPAPPPEDPSVPAAPSAAAPRGQGRAPAPASALAAEGFESRGEQRGVRVYRREKQPGIELAADGVIRGAPRRVQEVLIDYPSHRRWQKRLEEQRVLAKGDGFLDVYERLDLPMLEDRDFVLHVTWGAEGDVAWVRFAASSSIGPAPVPGAVRVTAHQGSWRLEPTDGGKATYAVYRVHIDLAGTFPSWLGTGQATNELPDLFDSITRELPRYP